VSRVLNGKDDVAVETVEKVQKVIKDLGYASSLAARGMRSHHTNIIGLVVPDVATMYCIEIMQGVNQAIRNMDYDLIIYTNGGPDRDRVADQERSSVALLNGGIADGVIVVTPTATDFSSHAPVVVIDPNSESPDLPAVLSTNYEGALAAMTYLTGLGHQRIGHILGRMTLISGAQRLQGYKDSLAAAGIPVEEKLIELGDYTYETALDAARKLLSLEERPTAIFAANDVTAKGIYQAAKEIGVRIPEDLSVVGFDNLRETAFMTPALTTVDQFMVQMGAIATEMIVKLINGETLPCNLHILQTHLIVRNSCRAIH
jgi:LacI family transcriptional regulator